jgi:CheY-like chemotaxis protein
VNEALKSMRILALCTEEDTRRSLEAALRNRVAELCIAESLGRFLAALPEHYDAAIIDTGNDPARWEAQQQIIVQHGKVKLPVLLLHPAEWKHEMAWKTGSPANIEFIGKPLEPALLLRLLASAVEGTFVQSQKQVESSFDSSIAARYPLRILLAEDHPVNQLVAKMMLAKLGYEVAVVSNGLEAVEAVKAGGYDVVLMDVEMPEMDGLQAAEQIRKLDLAQPKIVAVTASASDTDREACKKAGMDAFLSKPIPPGDLRNLLQTISSQRTGGKPSFSAEIIQALQKHTVEDQGTFRQLFDVYFGEARASLLRMQESLDSQDLPSLKKAAHHLKGSSNVVGASRIGYLCASLEAISALNDLPIRSTLDEITRALLEAESAAQGFLRGTEDSATVASADIR